MISGTVPGDRGHPAAEAVPVTREAGQVAGYLKPGLRGHVVGVGAHDGLEVPQHSGLYVPVEHPEGSLVTGPRRRQSQADSGGLRPGPRIGV